MDLSGIKFFLDIFQEPIDKVLIGFDFISGNNSNLVYPEKSVQFGLTGNLNNANTFYQYYGTGFFDGNTIISFDQPINFNNNYTFLFSYEKQRAQDEILLSSFLGNSNDTYSGFYIGINDANKIYFRYWNPVEGAFTFTYSKILSDKNLVFLSRNSSTFSIGSFNNSLRIFDIENFDIYENAILQSDRLYIGGTNVTNNLNQNSSNFSGLMDRFYLINNLPLIYINTISSGFYASPISPQGYMEQTCFETGYNITSGYITTGITGTFIEEILTGSYEITGLQEVQTGYCYQGLTGYNVVQVGTFINNCGNQQIIYNKIPLSGEICEYWNIGVPSSGWVPRTEYQTVSLTGFISGDVDIRITGLECQSFFVKTGDFNYYINTGYLESLSYPEISLFFNINSPQDLIEIYNENFSTQDKKYNQLLRFNNILGNHFYIDEIIDGKNKILLFANGQCLIDSGYNIQNIGYEVIRSPNLDYFLTGNYIETKKAFTEQDYIYYDYFSGDFNAFPINQHSSGSIINADFNQSFVFLNGQKLVSGVHYINNILNLNIFPGSNYIIIKKTPNLNYTSGSAGTLKINKNYNHNCSQVYFNGIKQLIKNNYIENSRFDRISGNFNFKEGLDFIYNNSNDFFE